MTEFDALRDKQAIAAVCYRYAFALDARDWTALRTCFTADATAYYRDLNATHGYPAIETRIRGALAPLSSTQHLIGNVLVRRNTSDRAPMGVTRSSSPAAISIVSSGPRTAGKSPSVGWKHSGQRAIQR